MEINSQKAMNDIAEWCKQNGMVFNFAKTNAMLITLRQKKK